MTEQVKEVKKITLEDLLAKKLDDGKKQTVLFYSNELGGEIEVRKIPLNKILNLIDDSEILSTSESMARNYELIYECCPVFHNVELLEKFEAVEPFDIVPKIFNENIGEINALASVILDFYGVGMARLKDKVKK